MATTNFSIPELAAAQSQKHVTVNEALRVVDTAMNLNVIRADFTAPPGSPSEGDKYIPFATASGAWTGKENQVAAYINATWVFFAPVEGWRAYNQTTNELLIFDGTSWVAFVPSFGNGSASAPAYSFPTDADTGMYRNAANQLGFATGGAQRLRLTNTQITTSTGDLLLNNAGSNSTITINKNSAANDASFQLQSGFTTTALVGALGNNDFTIKVGTSFTTALVIDNVTGGVEIQQGLVVADDTSLYHEANILDTEFPAQASLPDGISHSTVTNANYPAFGGVLTVNHAANRCFQFHVDGQSGSFWIRANHVSNPDSQNDWTNWYKIWSELDQGSGSGLEADKVTSYTVAGLPSSSSRGAGALVFVTNESGGPVLAFSDGTNWRRVTDRAIVS